jgi:hypothetical protein
MGLFSAATRLVGSVVEGVTDAVTDTVSVTGSTIDTVTGGLLSTPISAVTGAVNGVIEGTVGAVTSSASSVVSSLAPIAESGLSGVAASASNLLGAAADEVRDALSDPIGTAKDAVDFLGIGSTDGLLGVNFFGSLLGGSSEQGVIPDTRGILGPLPINVGYTEQGLTLGGETPLTQLATAALALTPFTLPLVPLLAPLNLGGVGVSGSINAEGISLKLYGIAGPSYELGIANVGGTLETGNYTELKLLSWNDVKLSELPLIGGLLDYIPAVGDISFSLPTLDPGFDSKLYVQGTAGANLTGYAVGPNGQVEVVHDLDNDLSIVASIIGHAGEAALHAAEDGFGTTVEELISGVIGETAYDALASAGNYVAGLLGFTEPPPAAATTPEVQLVGSEAPLEQPLAA